MRRLGKRQGWNAGLLALGCGLALPTAYTTPARSVGADGAVPMQGREDELKKKEEDLRRREEELRKKEQELRAKETDKERKDREKQEKLEKEKAEKEKRQRELLAMKQKQQEEKEKKQREREEKKRQKAELEGKKRDIAAAAVPPPAAPPPEAAPPPAPAATAPPEPAPIEQLGDARWSTNIGFIAPGEAPADTGQKSAPTRAPAVRAMDLNMGWFEFGGGQLQLNPINDGNTDAALGFGLLDLAFAFRFEWRNEASLIAPWFGLGGASMFGERQIEDPRLSLPSGNTATLGVVGFRGDIRFGVDLQPVQYIGVGPVIGGHLETYSATVTVDSTSGSSPTLPSGVSDSTMQANLGLLYGVHARFRTRARPGEPSVFFADPAFTWKTGQFETAQYASLQLGVRAGSVYFLGWYERRVDASGKFTFDNAGSGATTSADTHTLSEDYAASSPIEQRIGIGMAIVMYGKD